MIESLEAQGLQLAKEKQEYLGKHTEHRLDKDKCRIIDCFFLQIN